MDIKITYISKIDIPKDELKKSHPILQRKAFHKARLTLTDPGGKWPKKVDNTRHIIIWGFQFSLDDGRTWAWGPTHQEEPLPGLPFGSRCRDGSMPFIEVESLAEIGGEKLQVVDPLGPAGVLLRFSIKTDSPITLGAKMEIT